MELLFDLGNSRVKWAAWRDGAYVHTGTLPCAGANLAGLLAERLRALPAPASVLIASVAGRRVLAAVEETVRRAWPLQPIVLHAQARQCGVRNAYAEPAEMGVDRWLAMIAAWQRRRGPVCVVDAGTAVTVDVVTAAGQHLGGLIVPGLALSRTLLAGGTAGIPETAGAPAACLGDSTAACVANGGLVSVLGTVHLSLQYMQRHCGAGGALVVTGGAAPDLLPHLPLPVEHVPDLVFDGMRLAGAEMLR
jgi:type III pantothenate kinase